MNGFPKEASGPAEVGKELLWPLSKFISDNKNQYGDVYTSLGFDFIFK